MSSNVSQTAIVQGSRVALIVLMEDELVHTDEHPFCPDFTCPCHDAGSAYMQAYLTMPFEAGLLTKEEALRLWSGQY